MTKFFINFKKKKKKLFLAHFPHFWGTFFPKKSGCVMQTPYGPLTPFKISEKTEPIPRKLLEGQKDERTLIHMTLPATDGVPKIYQI